MILDGRSIAKELYSELSLRRDTLKADIRLGIIVVGVDPVIEQFVRIKSRAAESLRVRVERTDLSASASTEGVVGAIEKMAPSVDALIVQLPLPKAIDTNAALSEIPPEKDVDAINPNQSGERASLIAPVALAVVEMLRRGGVEPKGKRVVVVGAGRLVGAPSAALLKEMGAHVSMFTLQEGSIEDLKDADIIVCGAGKPAFIKPEHVKNGVVLIDAGASEQGGVVRGDADPSVAEKASVFSTVPGGVGPVAVAMIFKNLFDLVEKADK